MYKSKKINNTRRNSPQKVLMSKCMIYFCHWHEYFIHISLHLPFFIITWRLSSILVFCTKARICTMPLINLWNCSSGSRIWSRGGGQKICRDLADVAKWSLASEASQYWPGSRARLRALGAHAFLTLKYAFSHFSWYFFFKILMYICVGTLTNIYFNMKDSDHLGKCNFAFLHMKKSMVFISSFGLVCRYITL